MIFCSIYVHTVFLNTGFIYRKVSPHFDGDLVGFFHICWRLFWHLTYNNKKMYTKLNGFCIIFFITLYYDIYKYVFLINTA